MKLSAIIRKEYQRLFFVLLSFLLMVLVSYSYVSKIVEDHIFTTAQEVLSTTEVTLRSNLREAELALLQAELLIDNCVRAGESDEEIGSQIAEMADSIKADSNWVQGFRSIYGFIHDTFITGISGYPVSGAYYYEDRPWYRTALAARNRVGMALPYIEAETGRQIITLAKTISDKGGRRIGIIALDVDFSFLASDVRNLNLDKGGYGLLCDVEFQLIAYPPLPNLTLKLVEISPGHARIVEKLKDDPSKVQIDRTVDSSGVSEILIFKRVYNGWYLGTAIPTYSFYRDVNRMAITLSVLGLIFMLILGFVLVQLSYLKTRSDEENLGKSSFLARMSHEIRTPMNSILGMAELIMRKEVSGEVREYIEIINQSGNSLLAIINDILDFSKIESGRLEIQKHEYNVASVINDMINIIRPRITEKSLDFSVNVDNDIPAWLYGDDLRLRQIMTNLLSNAVKYTRKGFVSLCVKMETVDDNTLQLICSVKDSGIGIKPEDAGKLFSEFARIDQKTNRGIEGTGLGLSITRALCRAMGGDVTVSSEYGIGSEFRAVVLQEYDSSEPLAFVAEPEKKKVLFYDWRPLYVQSLTNTFENLGVSFHCAQDFPAFARELEYGKYDFAFISSKHALECFDIPGIRDKPLLLTIMIEPGEISAFREVTSILMPVYSLSVANVLNNVSGTFFHDRNFKIQFSAPDVKILIVDDISTNLRVAKELMKPYGMDISTCMSGAEAVNLIRNNHYDLVFMDHMMPEMDGIEATALIRALESEDGYYKRLPIVALTANAISGQREMFLESGINDFLAKPIDIKKLDEILERWLLEEKRADLSRPSEITQESSGSINISGVDAAAGIRNCGGEAAIYFNILMDFCKDAENRLLQIADALESDNIGLYTTLVHALKGAARSIGAIETGEKAWRLEKAASRGDVAMIKNKTSSLTENVNTLIKNIRIEAELREAKDKREHIGISTLEMETLKTALKEMDIEAVNSMLLTFAGQSLDSEVKNLISEIEQHILMFEYEKAIEKIDELL